ncbi:MAG TPA: winged helix DNA-binding domain-containing protein [Vicinamibacterales bacterium]
MIESIARRRLQALRLARVEPSASAVEIVEAFGAVQAQDYNAVKWALALRAPRVTSADVDRALDEGRLLRTHVMRPTWQLVTPAHIGALLALTAPRVHQACAFLNRTVGLDAALRKRTQRVIRAALSDAPNLTRAEISAALTRARIDAAGVRLAAIVIAAELDALVCSGPRRGREFTYALFENRVPATPAVSREEELRYLTERYFSMHGPATVRDFAWWSGLTVATAREGIEMVPSLKPEAIEGKTYWSDGQRPAARTRTLHLLPAFDEYLVGYRDRDAVPYRWPTSGGRGSLGTIFVGAELVGCWRRVIRGKAVQVETNMLRALTAGERRALTTATRGYAAFYS